MVVVIDSRTGETRIEAPDDLKSLSVRLDGTTEPASGAVGDLGSFEGDHAWLDIAALRAACKREPTADWLAGYDGMIGYARTQGWVSEDGRNVRAHLEP